MALRATRTRSDKASKEVGELRRKVKILSTSRKLTHEFIGEAYDVKKLMQLVFDRILHALDAEAGSLWVKDNHLKKNICHLAEGPVKDNVIGLRLDFGVGVVGTVIESGKSKIILDTSKSKEFSQAVDQKTGFITHSMICVPLIIDEDCYGAIQVVNKIHGVDSQFDSFDCELVQDLAISAAISMKNARLMEMESKVKEMHALMTISNEVVSTLDIDQVLNMVVNRTNELIDINFGTIGLKNEESQSLSLNVISGGQKVAKDDPKQAAILTLMEQVQNLQRSVYVPDKQHYISHQEKPNDWTHYLEAFDVNSIWCSPLRDEEGVLGVIWFESDSKGFANKGKGDLLHIMTSQATVALRNASLFKSITNKLSLEGLKERSAKWWQRKGKRVGLITGVTLSLILSLHFLPVLRWVSAPTTVETQLGRGIFAPIDGRLSSVLVTEGDKVTKGQLVAQMDISQTQLALKEAEAQLAISERKMVEARAEKDSFALSNAVIERETHLAKVAKLQADVLNSSIVAPISGVILNSNLTELTGRHYAVGTEMFRIADPDNFRLVVHIPEEDVLDVTVGQNVRSVMRAKPGEYVRGEVIHVGRTYDVPTTILEAEEEVDKSELETGFVAEVVITEASYELLPGMTGQALIYTPESSVVERQWRRVKNFFIFTLGL